MIFYFGKVVVGKKCIVVVYFRLKALDDPYTWGITNICFYIAASQDVAMPFAERITKGGFSTTLSLFVHIHLYHVCLFLTSKIS